MKALLASLLLIFVTSNATASIISYAGYSHDTSTDIVTGGGLEWMQWDVTVGQSVDTALDQYSADGWRLATNSEMSTLFNDFEFGKTFDAEEHTGQRALTDSLDTLADELFIDIFGDTYAASGRNGSKSFSRAIFGEDQDSDGLYNLAAVNESFTNRRGLYRKGKAILSKDRITASFYRGVVGLALVRDYLPTSDINLDSKPSVSVPEPTPLTILALGLLGLMLARRQPQ